MLRSKRLEVVLKLEQRREQAALDAMTAARQNLEQQQQRLVELRSYQADYRKQMRASQQGVVSIPKLQGWQAFIVQLDQVITQQERQVSQAENRFEAARKGWQQAYERRRGMERHIETCRQQEERERDQREQKQADEAAGRAFARRR
ncbi:MAG: flagellar export protein FliJ [Marinobacter sp.]|uniref:flagellar export protein FliJ n=1 Tax=Marinobacter sp. TaxID=50741 RepID=UPI00299F3381|nr:flagellar export protein FliJ [Marinobacter sp.]MDX1633470.1 flagellar export protein FliJ [Marinobacter sp.]